MIPGNKTEYFRPPLNTFKALSNYITLQQNHNVYLYTNVFWLVLKATFIHQRTNV